MEQARVLSALNVIMGVIDDLLPIPPPPTPPSPPQEERREELEQQILELVKEVGVIDSAVVEMERAFRRGNGRRAVLYLLAYFDAVITKHPQLKQGFEPMIQHILAKLPAHFSS